MRIKAHYELDEAARARLEQVSTGIAECFASGGYRRISLPVLQPADLYLDMAGEDIRERMFVFEDPAGAEMCLRADLTIPVCRAVLDEHLALPARLACLGSVYRFQNGDGATPAEMIQAGIECLGAPDASATDAEVFELAHRAVTAGYDGAFVVEIGDVGLFTHLLSALDLPAVWAKRLSYAFRHPSLLHPTLAALRSGPASSRRADPLSIADAEHLVRQKLGANDAIGGRSVTAIAARLVEKAEIATVARPSPEALDVIERFLAIEGDLPRALSVLRGHCSGEEYVKAVARLEQTAAMAQKHLSPRDELRISTTLGRNFVYYTGFAFSIGTRSGDTPLAAGGRYDRLMSDLGASAPIPAVGCAVWPERMLAAQNG